MSKELLKIDELTVSFPKRNGKKVQAVNSLSFSVNEDEIVGIIGESGSGKTVTIKNMMRLIPSPPENIESGDIYYKGKSVFSMTDAELQDYRGNEVSMIFQNPMSAFNPVMKIGRQISEAYEFHNPHTTKEERDAKVLELFKEVGISHGEKRINQYPHEFSGGMLQRAMIAAALVQMPKLILADEPTTGLDVTIQAQIISLMKRLKKKYSMSIVWITHDLSLLAGFAEKLVIMYAGHAVEIGSREDIYYHAVHPYTKGLLKSIPSINKSKALYSIEGLPPDPSNLPPGCPFAERCPYAKDICREVFPERIWLSETHRISCHAYKDFV